MIRTARARLACTLALSGGAAIVLHVTGHGFTIADVVAGILTADLLAEFIAAGTPPTRHEETPPERTPRP